MREMWAWENAVHVPSEEYATVKDAAEAAPPGAHVLIAAGMHLLPETLVIKKRLHLLGEARYVIILRSNVTLLDPPFITTPTHSITA